MNDRDEFLVSRIRDVIAKLNRQGRLNAMESWPKGSNGPLAVAAYEALAWDARWAVVWLETTLQRIASHSEAVELTEPRLESRFHALAWAFRTFVEFVDDDVWPNGLPSVVVDEAWNALRTNAGTGRRTNKTGEEQ